MRSELPTTVYKTCKAVTAEYMEEAIDCQQKSKEWKNVAKGFANRWNSEAELRKREVFIIIQ